MNSRIKLLLLGLLALSFVEQCKPKTKASTPEYTHIIPVTKAVTTTRFDTMVQALKGKREITKSDVLSLAVFDTTYANASTETVYCDTTVQLNESNFYSVVILPDVGGNCSHYFIVTIDEKNRKAIASEYLKPDCDIDYSWDSYDLFDYKVVSKDSIQLIKTTVFQKKNSTSDDEEQNIDHKETEKSYFVITPLGKIKTAKSNSH